MGTVNHNYTGAGVDLVDMSPYNFWCNRTPSPVDRGWIYEYGIGATGDPGPASADVAHVVYVNGDRKYNSGWGTFSPDAVLRIKSGLTIRIEKGDIIKWGLFNRTDNHHPRIQTAEVPIPDQGLEKYWDGADAPGVQADLPAPAQVRNDRIIRGYFHYLANNAPLVPQIHSSSPAQGSTITTTNPTIGFTLPHGNDTPIDDSVTLHIKLWRLDGGAIQLDTMIEPTTPENDINVFSRSYDSLPGGADLLPGVTYVMQARHEDSWGDWSGWSATRTFTIGQGPNQPDNLTPSGKIDVVGGFNYTAQYTHNGGLSANAAELEVWNSTGTTRIYNTQVTGLSVLPSTTYTKAEWHTDLLWGTSYTWRIRFRDTTNIWGEWSGKKAFHTNSAPSAPTGLSPGNNAKYAGLTFTAVGTDPNNDDLTGAQIEIVRVSDNVIVHTRTDTGITINNVSGDISYTLDNTGGILVNNVAYKWRIRTKDANFGLQSWGTWSAYASFTWVIGATITPLAPRNTSRVNLIRSPSPAAILTGATQDYWTEQNVVEGVDQIMPVSQEESPSRDESAWEAISSGVALATANRYLGEMEPIDITKPYLAMMYAQRMNEAETSGTYFRVLCYNSGGTLVGTLYPSDVHGALNNANISMSWEHYGGAIGVTGSALQWPATTTQARIEIIPSAGSAATVQFTAVHFEQLPVFASNSDWQSLRYWYGYGDGGTDIEPTRTEGYSWLGDEGNSESTSRNILEELLSGSTKAFFGITYSHGVAKHSDRMYIDEWVVDRWVQSYDTGWVTSTRTLIPLPQGVLRNEGRFRFRLFVRDTNLITVEVTPVEADVYYLGPPEIHIISAEEDAAHGRIVLQIEDSTLPANEFGGIEIARVAQGEPQKIVARLGSTSPGSYLYEAPTSGVEYTFKIRQVQLVGTDRVEGRWNTEATSVDYSPNFFIKDVDDPHGTNVGFRVRQQDFQPDTTGATETRHEIRGRKRPIYFIGEGRSWTRELTMYLNEGHGLQEPIHARWDLLKKMDEERPTVIVLDSYHKTKMIAQIIGESTFDLGIGQSRRVTFNLEAVDYSEDYRDREGLL